MDESISILLLGLKAREATFASNHFSKSGYRIITSNTILDAKEILKTQKIDLIYFQAASDYTAVSEFEEIPPEFASFPIVLLCAKPTETLVLNAWHAGVADVVFLPLTSNSLDISLQHGIRQSGSRRAEQSSSPVQARLFYIDENGKECWVNILRPKFTIGRSSGNDLILSNMGVSRYHAELALQKGEYFIRDLGSKQGTLLNGIKVEQSRLTEGDRVQLGGPQGTILTFHEGDLLQSLLADSNSKITLSVHGFKDVGMLFAAFRAFSSIPVLDDLLSLVVDTAIELTSAERGFIMLKEKDGNLGFRCARNNHKQPLDGSCFQTSRRVPFDVFKTGRSIAIRDLDLENLSEDHLATRRLGLRSISCVPLRYAAVHESLNNSVMGNAENIGVLYVDSSIVGTGFSHTKMDALESLASEAAMAIYNAKLYKDSQDKHKMDEQLAIAREIQQALLPQPNKELPYVRACSHAIPCNEVGGDYYDYFSLDDGRLGFALGDVAGKGMPAALLASLIQGVLSAQNLCDSPLADMMGNVNRNLAQRGTGNRFVTFFFGILDPDGSCTYVNAGHNPPFLLSRSGEMKELTVGGMVLGLFPGAQYEAETIKLQPGDHLVLFTDGVVEALNTAEEEFGMDRLSALLHENAKAPASEILDRLREAVLSFSANAPQHDDITMMILGYQETPGAAL
jgi:phosphoserine phosphatase RsbU/P